MTDRSAGSRKFRPAVVRFYLDADILGLAKLLVQVRNDVAYPGDPGERCTSVTARHARSPTPATFDPEWIPQVAARGWLIITRDGHIQDRRAEIGAVRDNGTRMVALAGRDADGTFDQLEVVMCQWRRMSAAVEEPGPFIYSVTRTILRPVSLD